MIYNGNTKDIIVESNSEYRNVMTLTQPQSLVKIATVNSQLDGVPFPFALYDELYKFNRKESVRFLMTGISDDFFDDKIPREQVISWVGTYYYNKHLN